MATMNGPIYMNGPMFPAITPSTMFFSVIDQQHISYRANPYTVAFNVEGTGFGGADQMGFPKYGYVHGFYYEGFDRPGGLMVSDISTPLSVLWQQLPTITGQQFADAYLTGSDTVLGGGGPLGDYIMTGDGADSIWGYPGSDTVFGQAGNDTIWAGDGLDYVRGDDGDDSLTGGADFDDLNGNKGDDTVRGYDGDDWVVGGQGNDWLYGEVGDDVVYGNLGADTQDGGVGRDWVRGGQGNDSLSGGAGDDWMSGDLGDDTLSGGSGADTFHTWGGAGIDRVIDFNPSQGDRVQLDAGTGAVAKQVGADVVIDMDGGGKMILVGVSMASLTDGWVFAA